jgi:glutathione S-transferase
MKLYELRGKDDVRFSTFAWRSRMALLHKGLDFERVGVGMADKETISFSGQKLVPILVDGETTVTDSWRIAEYLEDTHPDAPSLFGGDTGRRFARFFNSWIDSQVMPVLFPLLAVGVTTLNAPEDEAHFRGKFEGLFKKTLEELAEGREAGLPKFQRLLAPARDLVKAAPFIGGAMPLYPDYALYGVFIWARIVSSTQVLKADDPLAAWFERMLDLYEGEGRRQRAAV